MLQLFESDQNLLKLLMSGSFTYDDFSDNFRTLYKRKVGIGVNDIWLMTALPTIRIFLHPTLAVNVIVLALSLCVYAHRYTPELRLKIFQFQSSNTMEQASTLNQICQECR